jgi:nitroreductase
MHDNETLRTIRQRRSIRNYKKKQISDNVLKTIIEAGIYAPHGSGQLEEFIHFAVIQNKNILDQINKLAIKFAKQTEWFKDVDEHWNCLYDAPTLIIVSYNENWTQPETDCAAVTQNMLLAAESIGLGGCWLYFPLQAFNTEDGTELKNELKVPEGHKPVTSIILGYKENAEINIPERTVKNIDYIR